MEPARWERVQALFHLVVALPPAERADRLREACGEPELAAEVLALLEEDERAPEAPPPDLARLASGFLTADGAALPRVDFGPYRVRTLLGEGGMGVVYLAERADLGSLAAIKVLRDAWLSPARRERFAAEQRTLAQLDHPSIARLFDADSLPDGTPWFVMEYVEGVPLTEYCREHRTTIEGRLELFRAVCEAVQYAHGQALVHRDLKPSNILVKADGSVKLLDFGIAKHLEALDSGADATLTGLRFMTPAYAAPEQLRGERLGIQTDVYALGVILYELLAQRMPFDLAGRTPLEAASVLLESEPMRPSAAARSDGPHARGRGSVAWADLDVLCLTAMHRDPARRYPTVEALIRDVGHFLASEPLEARPDAVGYRLGKFVRRHRAAVVAGASAFLVIAAMAGFYTRNLATARDEARAQAARTARIQRLVLNLFEGGDEAAGPAEDLRVVTLVERGVEEAGALAGEPLVQAELYRTLGSIYQKLGDFEQADGLLASALERQVGLLDEGDPEVASTRVAIGSLRLDQARYDEAERVTREGLAALRKRLAAEDPAVARALAALGQVLEARGDYTGAIAVNEELVALLADSGETAELAAALGQLADSHYYAGDRDTADSINQRLLETTRRLYGEKHPRVADVLVNLGATQVDRGHYLESEAFFRPALEILSGFHGPEHYRAASCMTMLGRALVYQQKFDEAETLLERALAIQERVNGPVHPRVASALNDLGSAALMQDRLDEAEARFRRMLEIYRAVYKDGHYLIGIATANVASVLTERKEYALAEALHREAIEVYERTLSPGNLHAAIGRIKLGRVLLRQERYAEAEVETRAGYETVSAQASPSVSWLRSARMDLAAEYEALGQPERAAEFRAALAQGSEAEAR